MTSLGGAQTMKIRCGFASAAVIAATALSACRQEVPHKPMKLGGDVPATEQVKRLTLGPKTNLMERSK
jgi:hypothetical protein